MLSESIAQTDLGDAIVDQTVFFYWQAYPPRQKWLMKNENKVSHMLSFY